MVQTTTSLFFFFNLLQRRLSRPWSLQSPPRRKRSEGRHEVTSQVYTKHMQMIVKRVTCNNYQVQFLSEIHQQFISYQNKKGEKKQWISPAWLNTVMKYSPMDSDLKTNLHYLLHCNQSGVSEELGLQWRYMFMSLFFYGIKSVFSPSPRVYVYNC